MPRAGDYEPFWPPRPRKLHHAGMDGKAPAQPSGGRFFGLTASERQIRPPRAKLRGNQYQLGAVELATAAISKVLDSFFNDICAKRPAGIDVKRTWQIGTMDVEFGR